jgi:hypothetical protein
MKPNCLRVTIAIFFIAVNTAYALPADELSLSITIVTGERSKDSHSITTSLTLSGDKLTYQQSYHGAHSGSMPAVKKEYRLNSSERDELIKLLREKHLLITRTLAALPPNDEPASYFSLLIRSRLEGKEHLITIKLPRTAPKVKSDPLYQDSVAVITQLFRIINKTDSDISMPELIH